MLIKRSLNIRSNSWRVEIRAGRCTIVVGAPADSRPPYCKLAEDLGDDYDARESAFFTKMLVGLHGLVVVK